MHSKKTTRSRKDKEQVKTTLDSSAQPVQDQASTSKGLTVVGIGASAGGLEALRVFVGALPQSTNMAYVVAQHMAPQHRSMMADLLSRETKLNVCEVQDGMVLQANTVYVGPPNSDIFAKGGTLRLRKPLSEIGAKPSVDYLLTSLAEEYGERAVGIIMSGTGSDGTHGIRAIHAAGGICIAQKPETAKHNSMPVAAINAGVDLVLPPGEIAAQLLAIVSHPRATVRAHEAPTKGENPIQKIVRLVFGHTKLDFSNYKDATITRQIERRMAVHQIDDIQKYINLITENPNELNALAISFLVCVTSFFRDKEAFGAFAEVIRKILRAKKPGDDIRIWVPGSATGEEAYSIAIIVAEELGQALDSYKIQIFATDVNHDATQFGRRGLYPETSIEGLDSAILKKYFHTKDRFFQVERRIRDLVVFAQQDLTRDPPFVRVDAVSCRNLLIYFNAGLQEKVFRTFHYALNRNGVLFLGKSESIGQSAQLFAEIDRVQKIFRKQEASTAISYPFSNVPLTNLQTRRQEPDVQKQAPTLSDNGHAILFEAYAPPSVLTNADGNIAQFYGDVSPYVSLKPGKADFKLYSMVHPGIRTELRAIVQKVIRSRVATSTHALKLEVSGKEHFVRIAVRPVHSDPVGDDYALVTFEDVQMRTPSAIKAESFDDDAAMRMAEVEHQLTMTRESLQTVIEELETSNEELQALNEESQAANEELQASNEELETSNEELQATNEELTTVNDELTARTQELADALNDMENIQNSSQLATLVVDSDLIVRRTNTLATNFFKLEASDAAQGLASVPTYFTLGGFIELVRSVARDRQAATREFDFNGRYFELQVFPYQGRQSRQRGGAVLNIRDVTERYEEERWRRLQADVSRHLVEAPDLRSGLRALIQAICYHLGWQLGQFWQVDADRLRIIEFWHAMDTDVADFISHSKRMDILPGDGLPGRVWTSKKTAWSPDVSHDLQAVRESVRAEIAKRAGLRGAFAFPVFVQNEFGGVLEFYSRRTEDLNESLQATFVGICNQIGQFVARQLAEHKLRESEAQLSNALQIAEAWHWEYDAATDTFLFNDKFYRIFRTTVEAVGGYRLSSSQYISQFCHPSDASIVTREIRAALETKDPSFSRSFEHRFLYANGTVGQMSVRYSAIKDSGGRTVKLHGVNQDITDRVEAESRARLQLEIERTLVEAADLPAGMQGLLRKISAHLGWPLGQLWRRFGDRLQFMDVWHVNDASFLHFVQGSRKMAFAGGEALPGRVWASGKPVWIPDLSTDVDCPRNHLAAVDGLRGGFAVPLFARGELWGVIEFFSQRFQERNEALLKTFASVGGQVGQFIERHEAEQRLRHTEARNRELLEGTSDLIQSIAEDGSITYVNRAWHDCLEFNDEDIRRIKFWDTVHPDCRDQCIDVVKRVFSGERVGRIEWKFIGKSGRTVNVEGFVSIASGDNTSKQIHGMFRDVTERVRAQDSLRQAKEVAESANRAKSDFLAVMSHEIRTPLNAILGLTSLLQESRLDPKQRMFVETSLRSGEALLVLINDILDISKVESGEQLVLEVAEFSLSALVDSIVRLLQPRADSIGIDLVVDISADMPTAMYGDDRRLRQVLLNLVGNAIKFTERGQVTIRVRVLESRKESVRLRCEVQDTGVGIDVADLARLFEPFTQVDSSSARRRGGTGLGLAISKRIITMMGGEIGVESNVGHGSLFWFELNMPTVAHLNVNASRPTRSSGVEFFSPASPKVVIARNLRILAAEDNDTNRLLLRFMLDALEQKAQFVQNGVEAVNAWKADKFDIILMDCQMPTMDGFEAAREIRRQEVEMGIPEEDQVHIIALTANALKGDRERCIAAGMNGYLSKPYSIQQLRDVLAFDRSAKSVRVTPATEPPREASVNVDETRLQLLLAALGKDAVHSIADDFLRDLPTLLQRITDFVHLGGNQEVAIAAHSLRGIGGSLGMVRLVNQAQELEDAANANDSTRVQELARVLTEIADADSMALRRWLATLTSDQQETSSADVTE